MEFSMSKEVNVLIVTEGAKTEQRFINQISSVYETQFNVFCYGTNIYDLYKRMKEMDFNGDLTSVLLELPEDPSIPNREELLNRKYAYTYLVFDFDAHHTEEYERNYPIEQIVKANVERLREMTLHFTNETDPTIGKLYVNYPMMESYRDADSFFDNNYENNYVELSDIGKYKETVGAKGLARIRIDRYTKENFDSLASMNVHKLSKLSTGIWKRLDYSMFRKESEGNTILQNQERIILENNTVCVLNTTLFLLIDYYGNKNGFYDELF